MKLKFLVVSSFYHLNDTNEINWNCYLNINMKKKDFLKHDLLMIIS